MRSIDELRKGKRGKVTVGQRDDRPSDISFMACIVETRKRPDFWAIARSCSISILAIWSNSRPSTTLAMKSVADFLSTATPGATR